MRRRQLTPSAASSLSDSDGSDIESCFDTENEQDNTDTDTEPTNVDTNADDINRDEEDLLDLK
jgi:hypothetical protein